MPIIVQPLQGKDKKIKVTFRLKLGGASVGKIYRRLPHSTNVLNKMHWAVRNRWKQAWQEQVWAAWQEEKTIFTQSVHPNIAKRVLSELPYQKAKVTFFIFSSRPMDKDNSWGSVKGIQDALKINGLIKDDGFNYLKSGLEIVRIKAQAGEHVEIVLKGHRER